MGRNAHCFALVWCLTCHEQGDIQPDLNSISQAGKIVAAVQRANSSTHDTDCRFVKLCHMVHMQYMYTGSSRNLAAGNRAKRSFHR